ncbi:MAG: hypothetical protein HC860_02375 [Alkalinema sp. RU_4_3]|nr:hypothetical protein [Alkalinema sp. RU_4_3]
MKRKLLRAMRIGAIVIPVLSIVLFPTIEAGSLARAGLGINAIARIIMGGVAWTQKV